MPIWVFPEYGYSRLSLTATEMVGSLRRGWGNTQSVIRREKQGTNFGLARTLGILSQATKRPFWISWENNFIKVRLSSQHQTASDY